MSHNYETITPLPAKPIFLRPCSQLTLLCAGIGLAALIILQGMARNGADSSASGDAFAVIAGQDTLGWIIVRPLGPEGDLRLAFEPYGELGIREQEIEWWQLAERQDRPGYPRIDPQSGGSGLPGARGEDEDPAYYSVNDYTNPVLSSRVFADGKYWLLDRPTHDSGFNFESWLVKRTGPKSVTQLAGITWGITVRSDGSYTLRNPAPLRRLSRFNWEEALRISGFGSGWTIKSEHQVTLP